MRPDTCLIMFAPDQPDAPWRWVKCVDGQVTLSGTGCEPTQQGRRILVVPGWAVAARRVYPQGKGRIRHTDALFLAEESIASDIDDLHTTAIHNQTRNSTVVWMTDPEKLATWIAQASSGGSSPQTAIPDYMCLPDNGRPSIYRGANMHLVRDGLVGVRVDHNLQIEDRILETAFVENQQVLAEVFTDISDPDALCRAMADGALACETSLLSGPFAPVGQWRTASRLWKVGATLAAACVAAGMALVYLEAKWLEKAANRQQARTEHILSRAFDNVQDNSLGNRWSLVRRLQQDRQDDFLVLSGILTNALKTTPGIGVQKISFNADNASMTAQIRFDSFRSIGALDKAIRIYGVHLTEGASRQDGNSRTGQITLMLAR